MAGLLPWGVPLPLLLLLLLLPLLHAKETCFFGNDPIVSAADLSNDTVTTIADVTHLQQIDCEGPCVVVKKVFPDRSYMLMRGCQRRNGNRNKQNRLRPNFCVDDFEHAYLITYSEKNQLTKDKDDTYFFKKCCYGRLCNLDIWTLNNFPADLASIDQHLTIVPYVEVAIILAGLVTIIVWPFYYLNKYEADMTKLQGDAYMKMEDDLLSVQTNPVHDAQPLVYDALITGQLSIHEVATIFAEADMVGKEKKKKNKIEPNKQPLRFSSVVYKAGGHGHGMVRTNRTVFSKFDSLFWTLVEHGPYMLEWRPIELVEIFDEAKDLFAAEHSMLNLKGSFVVIGDLRGQYSDLHRWLQIVGYPPKTRLLFLGGVLDQNEIGSLDCLAYIALLKITFPEDVFMIRGVGETLPFVTSRFSDRNSSAVNSTIRRMCSYLPIAAKINNRVLCVHSGICHQLTDTRCFSTVRRPFEDHDMPPLAQQIIFNIPTTKIRMYKSDNTTRGERFGFRALERVIKDLGLDFVVRGRTPIYDGICWNHRNKLASLWSAPNRDAICGTVLQIDEDMHVTIHTLRMQDNEHTLYVEETKKKEERIQMPKFLSFFGFVRNDKEADDEDSEKKDRDEEKEKKVDMKEEASSRPPATAPTAPAPSEPKKEK